MDVDVDDRVNGVVGCCRRLTTSVRGDWWRRLMT